MLLHKPVVVQFIPKTTFTEWLKLFNEGRWQHLLKECTLIEERTGAMQTDMERRAARAENLVALGKLSSPRQALEAAEIAP